MDMGDAETRARVWAALGNQPGMSAWLTVWLLARFSGAESRTALKPAAPARRGACQVWIGH
jgi:hypothetical protein